MKILILGAGGMIGHKMFLSLQRKNFKVYGTLKKTIQPYDRFQIFTQENCIQNIDVTDRNSVEKILMQIRPDAILNCVGITLRKAEISDEIYCQNVNAEFPHFLNAWVIKNNSYLIHFSTDCVFSGKDGPYVEESSKSASDIYGRTKAAGEVIDSSNCLTLRGSMIGRELVGKTELLEWALSKKEQTIKGFSKAMYSGVTTGVMANLVADLLVQKEKLSGLYQVSSQPISKYDLLKQINYAFELNMRIVEDATYASQKILISDKLKRKIGFVCPGWFEMVDELTKDLFNYSE